MLKLTCVVLAVTMGIWGCARKPAEANGDRIRSLEARCAKLEQDYRTVAQARDRARKEVTTLEEKVGRLESEAADRDALVRERDQARKQVEAAQTKYEDAKDQLHKRTTERDQANRDLNVRTAERDTALSRYEKLRKTLQQIVAQDEGGPAGQQNTEAAPANGPVIGVNQ